MAITVEVKPDFSAFVPVTAQDVIDATGCDPVMAEAFVENFTAFRK